MLTGPVMKVGIPEAFTSRTEPAGGQADRRTTCWGSAGPGRNVALAQQAQVQNLFTVLAWGT
jgi:hypothetical protein